MKNNKLPLLRTSIEALKQQLKLHEELLSECEKENFIPIQDTCYIPPTITTTNSGSCSNAIWDVQTSSLNLVDKKEEVKNSIAKLKKLNKAKVAKKK